MTLKKAIVFRAPSEDLKRIVLRRCLILAIAFIALCIFGVRVMSDIGSDTGRDIAAEESALTQRVVLFTAEARRPSGTSARIAAQANALSVLMMLENLQFDLREEIIDLPSSTPSVKLLKQIFLEGGDVAVQTFIKNARELANTPDAPWSQTRQDDLRRSALGPLQDLFKQESVLHTRTSRARLDRVLWWYGGSIFVAGLLLIGQVLFIIWPLLKKSELYNQIRAESSYYDALTGVLNRKGFELRFEDFLRTTARGHKKAGLVLFDVDWMSALNETEGRAAGDLIIETIAHRLDAIFGEAGIVARINADGFAVAIGPLLSSNEIDEVANHIHRITTQPIRIGGRLITISTTLATSIFPDHGRRHDDMVGGAQMVLNEAKRDRRGCVMAFDAAHKARLERQKILREAFEGDFGLSGLFVEFQPQVSSDGKILRGFEALARWDHPTLGRIEPGEFLPIASALGRLPAVGRAVRDLALSGFATICAKGLPAPCLAINMGSGDMGRPDLLNGITSEIAKYNINPSNLEIEITERVFMGQADGQIRNILMDLHKLGMRISLDDFGTGFATLTHLRNLPIDSIKIDQSFIKDLSSDPKAWAIVHSMIELAHKLGISIIAEGVENEEQKEILIKMGCVIIQGFIYARPMPLNALIAWLSERPFLTTVD